MRFNVIERDPEMMFSGVRNNLENLLNAVMIGDASDLENRMYQPLSEVRENDTEYKVSVQLPGIKKEDINIELDKNTLTISAESKFEDVKDNENLHYSQFSYGKFHKTIELAKPVIGIKEPAPANFPILLKIFNAVKKALIPIKIMETIVPES